MTALSLHRSRWLAVAPAVLLATAVVVAILSLFRLWETASSTPAVPALTPQMIKDLRERGVHVGSTSNGEYDCVRVVIDDRARDDNLEALDLLARIPHVEQLVVGVKTRHRREEDRKLLQKSVNAIGRMTCLRTLRIQNTHLPKEVDLAPLASLKELETLVIPAGDERLSFLKELPCLRALTLIGTVSEGGLQAAAECASLESLDLTRCKLSDEGVARLRNSSLHTLKLDHTEIGDTAMASLGEMYRLRIVSLRHTKVTDAGLLHLKRLHNLKAVDLKGTAVTTQGLAVFDTMPPLQDIELP